MGFVLGRAYEVLLAPDEVEVVQAVQEAVMTAIAAVTQGENMIQE